MASDAAKLITVLFRSRLSLQRLPAVDDVDAWLEIANQLDRLLYRKGFLVRRFHEYDDAEDPPSPLSRNDAPEGRG